MNQTIITGGKKPKPSADELFKTTAVIRKHIEESAMYANVSENVHMGKFDNTALRPDCIRSTTQPAFTSCIDFATSQLCVIAGPTLFKYATDNHLRVAVSGKPAIFADQP